MALTDNIVSYWKVDESSGNAADSAGSNTLTNTNVTYSPTHAIINNGAVFNGTNAKLEGGSQWHPGASDFSISLWFYATSVAGFAILFDQFNDTPSGVTNQREFLLGIISANLRFDASSNGTADTVVSGSTTILANTLYHMVAVKTSSTSMQVYLNGVLDGTQTVGVPATVFSSTSPLDIGTSPGFGGGSAQWFPGTIDEVGTWNRALSAAEVTQLYNGGLGLQYPFPGAASSTKRTLLGVGL